MAMGNRGSIVIDVQAQITGYNESIERMKKALDEIDLGSSIGKKLSKGIAAAEKELASLGKEGMKRISSQGELDRLNDKLLRVGNLISDLGAGFQQVSWKDLTSGAAQELRDLEKQVNNVRQATQNIVGDGFSKLITEAPELKKVFDELKIDPNRMGLNTIEEKFTQTIDGLDKQIKNFQQRLDRSRSKANEYQEAVNKKDKILASDLGKYAVGNSRSDSYKLFQTNSGQKNIFNKKPEQINAYSILSKEYIDEVKNLGNTILTNLNLDPARQKNPELLAQLRPQIEAKIQQLLEAQSAEAIKGILDDIDNSLKLQEGSGFTVQGKRLKGLAEITGKGSAASIITERLTSLMTTSKIAPNEFYTTKGFMNSALEQLRTEGNYDTSDIQTLLDSILPTMSEEDIKTRFNIVAKAIVDGARQIKEAGEKADNELNKENGVNADISNYDNLLKEAQAKRDQVSQAQQKVDPLINELRDTIRQQGEQIKTLEARIDQLTEENSGKESPFKALGAETIENTAAQIEAANLAATQYQHKLEQIQSLQQGLNNLQSFAQRWFSIYGAMRLVSNTFKSIKTNIKELDDIMTEIAIVTDMSQADLWQQMPQYISLAKEYASSLKGVYEVSQLYYQQGLQQADVMAMTEETLKMARISGLSYSQATDYMTNAVRSFRMEMSESQRVVDVYSALAASSATSTTELATAMSKTASSAQAVGSSFENTTAMMAVMIEATREAPENIGTAMKSIISRYGEMTTNPTKLVDAEGEEMSLNKVDKALQTVGISIHDAQGQFRDFDDVIMELAASWDTIDKNTQRYIATVMAGNRQQSRFLALVSNYERLVELSDEAANSEDAATLQVMKTMDSVSAKAQQLQTSLQSMYTQTGLEEFYKGVLDFTNGIIATFTQMPTMFKLPIPAILAFGQMFINVGTSLASVIKMLRDKLSTASAATEKEMVTAQQIAGKERITAEEKVWLEKVQAAKKGAEQINGIERGLADTANQVANQRMGAAQPTVAVTPTIDFSKFGSNANFMETMYKNPEEAKGIDLASLYSKEELQTAGLAIQDGILVPLQQVSPAVEEASQKTQGLWASLQQNKAATIGLRMVGSSISLIAASMGEATESARALKGSLQLVGGAMQAVSYAAMKNPYMAIFTGVMTAVQVLSTWIETDAERLERLKKAADESNTNYLQKKQDAKNLEDQINKLKELEKTQYDSVEARKEYLDMSNQIAEQHPELVSGYDSEGNAIIALTHSYELLAQAREEAAQAAQESGERSSEEAANAYATAEENKEAEKLTVLMSNIANSSDNPINGYQRANELFQNAELEPLLDNTEQNILINDFLKHIGAGPNAPYELQQAVDMVATKDFSAALDALKNSTSDTANEVYEYISSITEGMIDVDRQVQELRNKSLTTDEANLLREIDATNQEKRAESYINDTKNVISEFSDAGTLIDNYMLQQYEAFTKDLDKEFGEGGYDSQYTSQLEQFNKQSYQKYYDSIYEQLNEFWSKNLITDASKQEFSTIVGNRGNYTKNQFISLLEDNFGKLDNELKQALEGYYENIFTGADFFNAIQSRQNNGSTLKIGHYWNLSRQLGETELQNILSVYDTIDKQIQNKNISAALGQDILNSFLGIYNATLNMGEEAEKAQLLLSNWDDFSLTGFAEFRKKIEESVLSKENQDTLIELSEDFVKLSPINLETEFQTFSQKISSNMEDFEKAISNASKGMDFKDATELAQKLDKDITAFDFKDGKYFFDDFNAIADAYFGEYNDYITDLENAAANDLSKLMKLNQEQGAGIVETLDLSNMNDGLKAGLIERGIDVDRLQSVYKQFTEDQDKTTTNFLSYYADYLTNQLHIVTDKALEYITDASAREAINMGSISGFVNTLYEGESADVIAQHENELKEAIRSGNFDVINEQYRQEWMEKYKDLNSSIYQALTEGFSDESIIEADDLDEAKQAALAPLVEKGWIEQYGEGMYKVVANIADFYDEIVTEINNGPGSNKDKREMTAALHNAKYEDNIYSALEDVVSNFDNFSYEAGQSLAAALGTNVETLLSQGILSQNAQGNLVASYQDTLLWLGQNIGNMSNKEYNDLRAKLEATNNKQRNESIFADIIKNRDSLNEQQVADLATMLGGYYSTVSHMLQDNGDGTKSISLQNIRTIINSGIVQITDEIQQLIANEIDSIIASLNGLGDIQSKGTTKIADMQKQVAEINKLSGGKTNYQMQDLFTYSDTLHGFVYSSQGLVESARQMKEQLETLSGDERWAAEQMLENTRNTFLQNIDITGFLNAERITPQIEENLRNSIIALNQYYYALGQTTGFTSLTIIDELKKGGAQAVAIANAWAQAQGKELSASDVEAAYRREVSSLVDAIDTVISGAGALIDETTANLINAAGGKATELAGTGQYVVESAVNLYDAYNELLNKLKATGEATLADINKVAALALENKDGEQQAIDALGDAAGMTYTRFGEILAQAGYELSEELMNQLTSAGIVKQLGGSKMQIADFSAFADLMDWDAGSEEYVSAFKSYNDSLIEMNRKAEKNILEEAKALGDAKAGDQFNLTQLSDTLNKAYQENVEKMSEQITNIPGDFLKKQYIQINADNPLLNLTKVLQQYGANLQDGILTIGADANIPAIIQEISTTAEQYGGLLSSEMAALADTLVEVLKGYAELIQNGIKGNLSNVQADQLKTVGKQLGVEVDFTKTKEGLKVTQQSAIQLYNELKKIDALQGQMTLETLADSLEASNENYANVSTITARIAELQREIANLQPGDARLQMYREELATAEDILRVRSSTDSGSFDFMNRDLPNGMQNPIDYWNSTGEAYKAMNQAAKSGYMEIQDFYNIVNEMNNMAAASGQTLSFMGQTLSGKAEDAAALIEAGMSALKNVDGEGVKIALGSLGADFATGAADMTGDFDTGIKEMAKSQIKMLDAAIRMLEAIVAMENIDVNGDGLFDPSEIFADGSGLTSKDFTPAMNNWIRQMDAAAGGIEIGGKSLLEALQSLEPDQIVSLLNQLRSIDWTIGDADTFTQIQNVLSGFFSGLEIKQRGPSIFDVLDMPSDANSKLEAFNKWCEKADVTAENGQRLYNHLAEGNDLSIKSSLFKNLENLLGLTKDYQRETFKSFVGDKASSEEIQLWSQINIEWSGKGVKSAIYTDSEGEEHDLSDSDASEWSVRIKAIEEAITRKRTITDAGGSAAGATDGEPIKLHKGVEINTYVDAKGQYYFTYNGKTFGPCSSFDEAKEQALAADREARSGGTTVEVDPTTGELIRQHRWVVKDNNEMSKPEKDIADKFKKDLETAFKSGNLQEWFDANKDKWIGEDGTFTLPGFEELNLQPGETPEQFIKNMAETMFGNPSEIATGIQEAFTGESGAAIGQALMQGITDSLTTLTEITPGQLPEVASALGQVATQGERLKDVPWDKIAAGISAITNTQNGGNGGDGGEGGGNPHDRDTGITDHDRPTQYGNINQPIKLEGVKADNVDAAGSTITGDITHTGPIKLESKPTENKDNTGPTQQTPQAGAQTQTEVTLDSSGLEASVSVAQTSLDSINTDGLTSAGEAATQASEKLGSIADGVNKIPKEVKTNVNVSVNDASANISVKASVTAVVNVEGAQVKGSPEITGDTPDNPKSIKTKAKTSSNTQKIPSRVKGNVALAAGRGTLMGELGPELVVSGGRYYTVGNNGAEFVDLPDDAIVFNHKQTRRLLGSKKATTGGSRGTPVKSENTALSFATGNVSGPALASASAALAALKQIRAMWQSMLDASAKDLGGLAGSGGGGGGGGGNGEEKDKLIPSYATTEIQRWYTWLRKIYRLEQEITYQDTLQNKLQNDQIANGRQIYASYQKNLKNLREEISLQQKTAELQQKWLDVQGAKIEDRSDPLWKIFQYDKNQKLLTYRGNDAPKSGFGLDILEQLNRRNAQGIQVDNAASAAAQIKYLKSVNYDINSLLYNDDGSKIANVKIKKGKEVYYDPKTGKKMTVQEENDAQVAMVENFFEKVQAKMDEIDSLQESIDDTNNSILENENKINEILNSIRDNQIDLENKVLDAIVAREQAQIDALQDQRDALEDANSKFLDGLNESLSKEREMYQRNESQTELTKLQRQLSILQRSGGSASQIASLQKQITDKQRDMYFDERQAQIDALQEASDKQIERLDTQIDIMTEALEYQEKNGLLWGEVYEIMSRNETDIAGFISTWSDDFKEKGPTEINKMMTELLESAQIFTADRDKQTNWNNFKDTMSKNSKYADIMKDSNIQTAAQKAYEDEYIRTGGNKESSEKAAMAYLDSKLPKTTTTTNNNSSNNQPDESKAIATAPLAVAKVPYYSSADGKKKGNLNNKKGQVVQILQNKVGKKKNREKIYYNNKEYYVALSSFSKKNWKSTSVKKSEQEKKAKELGLKGAIKFKQGGLVDFTGPAWVDGTKRKPEAFLNASQTQFLKDSLTSSVRTSLPDAITGLNGILQDIAQAMNYKNGALDNAVIEHAEVNINVPAINNGMDARQVGELAFDELMKIARKSGTRALQRR